MATFIGQGGSGLCSGKWPVHWGKFTGTRYSFISGARISTFVDILVLFDKVERVLAMYFTKISLLSHWEILEKALRQHADNVRLGSYSAMLSPLWGTVTRDPSPIRGWGPEY